MDNQQPIQPVNNDVVNGGAQRRRDSRHSRQEAATVSGVKKDWVFTLNNPTIEEENALAAFLSGTSVRYGIVQREVGDLGTPHLQGYFELRRARAFSTVRAMLPRFHVEPRRGTRDQARDYCRKSATAVQELFKSSAISKPEVKDQETICEKSQTSSEQDTLHKM